MTREKLHNFHINHMLKKIKFILKMSLEILLQFHKTELILNLLLQKTFFYNFFIVMHIKKKYISLHKTLFSQFYKIEFILKVFFKKISFTIFI